jgi:hypothetical protein
VFFLGSFLTIKSAGRASATLLNELMGRAVNCAADRPAARWALARRESGAAPFGMPIDNAALTDDFCRAVVHPTLSVGDVLAAVSAKDLAEASYALTRCLSSHMMKTTRDWLKHSKLWRP